MYCSMAVPGDVGHLLRAHPDCTAEDGQSGTGSSAGVGEGPVAAGDVGGQCSRVEVAVDGAEVEDPAVRGGDDAAWEPESANRS